MHGSFGEKEGFIIAASVADESMPFWFTLMLSEAEAFAAEAKRALLSPLITAIGHPCNALLRGGCEAAGVSGPWAEPRKRSFPRG